jgi:hypothetical protein
MPQGSLKKIEVDLLLADLPLKLRDPPLRRRQRAYSRAIRRPFRRLLEQPILARATTRAQRLRTTGTEPIPPHVEILPQNLKLTRQRADILARQHSANRRQLEFSTENTGRR